VGCDLGGSVAGYRFPFSWSTSLDGLTIYNSWLADARGREPIHAWGIDLGTTNSTVAEVVWSPEDGFQKLPTCRCLELDQPTREGVYTGVVVPSVLAIRPAGGHWVGEGAKRLRTRPQEESLVVERTLFFGTKNDIGLLKTYYRAPEPYNHASKIAGHILRFLKEGAEQTRGVSADFIAVSVPASFQLNQRADTLEAARLAGIAVQDHELIDEPIAALIDYLFSNPQEGVVAPGSPVRALVFDFGGGTCDVAILEVGTDPATRQLRISSRAVSRYHRLGGGDPDVAIVHEHLIPALFAENNLQPTDLGWTEKKKGLEPQLLGTAEALKIAICTEIDRLQKFGRYASADKSTIVARQPSLTCRLGNREFHLERPSLSAEDWEKILVPFLDRDHLYLRETEYRMTQSVFAPITDALDRVGMSAQDVDFCLLVGGSTLIPEVRDAVGAFFANGKVCSFEDDRATQTAVARGAAWHAFHLEVTGKPLVQPVVHDAIALLTGDGDKTVLIPAGSEVPFPADGSFARLESLVVPKTLASELRMEVVAASSGQRLFQETWRLNRFANAGDSITVEFRLGSTQKFECRAYLADHPDSEFSHSVENPLVNVVNPGQVRLRIEETEEGLRQKGGGGAEERDDYVQLAKWYSELGQTEKAIDILKTALRLVNRADGEILHLQGGYYGDLRDFERQEKAYRAADECYRSWGGPMFNLALSYRNRDLHKEALGAIDSALAKEPGEAPYLTLRGLCLRSMERMEEAHVEFGKAADAFGAPRDLNDWELGWLTICAGALGDEALGKAARLERERRATGSQEETDNGGLRPAVAEPQSIARREP